MTANVHQVFKALSPIDHTEFPSNRPTLDAHLETSLADAHILISSIPLPAIFPKSLNLPGPPNADIATLQKEWKPVKPINKGNALGISVFKLSAKDGKGTWFARRSIHAAISFERFKVGLQHEFSQPEKNEKGMRPTPVRGIGMDMLVRRQSSELGKAEILQLSAQFPGPSAPRDFVEGCLSSSVHPADLLSKKIGQKAASEGKNRPRQFTLISKPVLNHPECEERSGYVRGTYESVEFIREIPLTLNLLARSQSTPNVPSTESTTPTTRLRGKTVGQALEEDIEAVQNHPVDWIMITRSDPGGSVPKWIVERATPGGIVKDAEKFLNTLVVVDTAEPSSSPEATQHSTGTKDIAGAAEQNKLEKLLPTASLSTTLKLVKEDNITSGGAGYLSGILNHAASGMTSPDQSMIYLTPLPTSPSDDEAPSSPGALSDASFTDGDVSETASIGTFATCDSSREVQVLELPSQTPSMSSAATVASGANPTLASGANPTPEERALAQFLKNKQKLDEKMRKEENRRTEREKKIAEKHHKNMGKQETKYRRALEKANEKQVKDVERRQREVQKKLEKEEKGRRKEIDELKRAVEGLTMENLQLRQRVEDLESEGRKDREVPFKVDFEKVEE